jgi:hypothetical protein
MRRNLHGPEVTGPKPSQSLHHETLCSIQQFRHIASKNAIMSDATIIEASAAVTWLRIFTRELASVCRAGQRANLPTEHRRAMAI